MHIAHGFRRMLVAALFSVCAHGAQADVVVVVSADSPIAAMSSDQVADIFLGKSATLPDGSVVIPIDQSESTPVRNEFYYKVTGKSSQWLKAYWSKRIFTGRGEPPREAGDSAAVKKLLSEHRHYIGYIDKSVVDSSVKVVLTIR